MQCRRVAVCWWLMHQRLLQAPTDLDDRSFAAAVEDLEGCLADALRQAGLAEVRPFCPNPRLTHSTACTSAHQARVPAHSRCMKAMVQKCLVLHIPQPARRPQLGSVGVTMTAQCLCYTNNSIKCQLPGPYPKPSCMPFQHTPHAACPHERTPAGARPIDAAAPGPAPRLVEAPARR